MYGNNEKIEQKLYEKYCFIEHPHSVRHTYMVYTYFSMQIKRFKYFSKRWLNEKRVDMENMSKYICSFLRNFSAVCLARNDKND